MKIGIVGLPNVGKSTLFKALTKNQVDTSNYPFCTIDPNVGVVEVPDERLEKLTQVLKPEKILPTTIEFFDIAGLVKNAHQGEGLGNQFLSHIRETDAICQVLRNFEDKNVSHVAGEINPDEDKETINLELIMKDLETVNNNLSELKTKAKGGLDKEQEKLMAILEKLKQGLDEGKLASTLELDEKEKELIKEYNLLTLKPMLYVYNVEDGQTKDQENNKLYICARTEAEMADLSEEEKKELGLKSTGLDQLIKASYKLLNLITFFTCQNNILQAWTVEQDTPAPQAAGRIHTDFENNFIKAEVINWQDLVKTGSEAQARDQGILRTEGKTYIVQDGDVIHFKN